MPCPSMAFWSSGGKWFNRCSRCLCKLAGGDPLGETPVGLQVHILVRAKPEKEQERGRRAEKRAQREGQHRN